MFFFPFCNVQNYGNLVFLSWKIIEIFLGLFVGTLIIQNCSLDTRFEIAFRWMPQNLTNEKSTLFSGNDLVPSGNKPLPELMLAQIHCHMASLGHMMTSSNGNIFRVTGHLCGEFTCPQWIPRTQPVTRSFDVFFDLRLNKRLSKQWWGWWFETLSCPLWLHRNEMH